MNQKQLREVANARAYEELRYLNPLRGLFMVAVVGLMLFRSGDFAILGALGVLMWYWGQRRVSNKHLKRIIQEKEAQVITSKEIKGIAEDRAMGIKFWLLAWICTSPIAAVMFYPTMPFRYRMLLIGLGTVAIASLVVYGVRMGRKAYAKTKEEFDKVAEIKEE